MTKSCYIFQGLGFLLLLSLQAIALPPDIWVSTKSIDFGNVYVDYDRLIYFCYGNDGRGPLNISRIDIIGDSDFVIYMGGESRTVNPGDSVSVFIDFSASSRGTKNATVRIFSDDPDENPVLITCTGIGITAVLTVNPTVLDFGIETTSLTCLTSNAGEGSACWHIYEIPDKPWIISVTPNYGCDNAIITVVVDHERLSSASDTAILTVYSNGGNRDVTLHIAKSEAVSAPTISSGPSTGKVEQALTFIAGGSESNVGDPVEYQFDWGDGSQSAWGPATQMHSYASDGARQVKVRARCTVHTSIMSDWSTAKPVAVSYCVLAINIDPGGSGTVGKSPDKTNYTYHESVQLAAAAEVDYKFYHWGGDLSGNENPISISMMDNKNVTANFLPISSGPIHFAFTQTHESYSLVINAATFDDVPLAAGDEIGIFTPAGLCVGASVWIGVTPLAMTAWKDDAQTSAIDGYKYGESMSFCIWQVSAGGNIDYPASATYATGNGTFGNGLYSSISKLEATKEVQQTITLKPGWSWISTNIAPKNPAVDQVFSQIPGLSILINGAGQFYIPGVINGIGDWQILDGYKLYVSSIDTLTVRGELSAPTTPIALAAGWNFISYLPKDSLDIETALASVFTNIAIAKQDDGKFFIPGVINAIGCMKMGRGYKLFVTDACTLTYPAAPEPDSEPLPKAGWDSAVHFSYRADTGESYSIIIDEAFLGSEPLSLNSEIGVFSPEGICVGAVVWDGTKPKALCAWLDDSQTITVKDGYITGEEMSFRIWNAKDTEIYSATAQYSFGTNKFEEGIYTRLSKLQTSTTIGVAEIFDSQPTEYKLQCYPNPFNPETNITFKLPRVKKVSLVVYNVHGERVATLVDGSLNIGDHKVNWNAAAEPSGLYLCHFYDGAYSQTLKLILVK